MNKRIYFILFPILAILFCIHCNAGIAVPHQDYHQGSSTWLSIGNKPVEGEHTYLPVAKKQDHKKTKNTIRIKAWDDASAVILPLYSFTPKKYFFYANTYYPCHYSFTPSGYYSEYNLRGPPTGK